MLLLLLLLLLLLMQKLLIGRWLSRALFATVVFGFGAAFSLLLGLHRSLVGSVVAVLAAVASVLVAALAEETFR